MSSPSPFSNEISLKGNPFSIFVTFPSSSSPHSLLFSQGPIQTALQQLPNHILFLNTHLFIDAYPLPLTLKLNMIAFQASIIALVMSSALATPVNGFYNGGYNGTYSSLLSSCLIIDSHHSRVSLSSSSLFSSQERQRQRPC